MYVFVKKPSGSSPKGQGNNYVGTAQSILEVWLVATAKPVQGGSRPTSYVRPGENKWFRKFHKWLIILPLYSPRDPEEMRCACVDRICWTRGLAVMSLLAS
ncbi:hypothetical protein E2C01_053139 [Portunus trituberculatus]|uniref:Uncharacterized protein n=1 Tax=Portunus trituberculatus TaxID=210409 RepID=A0A5B7GR77_PORTR|nr:hypothetical protein [Portunus trituberculatus]